MGRRVGWVLVVLGVVLGVGGGVLVVFGGSLGWGLLRWDDQLHLTGNPYLGDAGHFWGSVYAKLYIPVSYSVWGVIYGWCADGDGGLVRVWPLRLANVLVHGVNGCLVVGVCRALAAARERAAGGAGGAGLSGGLSGAVLGGLVFAVFPLQAESVGWVSEFRGLLAGAFSLGAIWLNLSGRRWLATLALVLGVLSKPSAVAAAGLMVVMEWWLDRERARAGSPAVDGAASVLGGWKSLGLALRKCWMPLVVAAVAGVAMPLVIQRVGGVAAGDATPVGGAWYLRPLVAADALAFYMIKVFWPVGLSADYSRTPALAAGGAGGWWFYLAWLVPAGLAALAVRWRGLRLPLAIFVAGVLPVLGLVPFEFQRLSTVADRYVYLSMLGPAVWVAFLPARRWIRAGQVGAVVVLGWLTWNALQAWRSDEALWSTAVRNCPGAVFARCNLGELYAVRGERAAARRMFERAHELDPRRSAPLVGLAKLARDAGNSAEAEKLYRAAIAGEPSDPVPVTDLGSLMIEGGRLVEAEALLQAGAARHPESADLRVNLAGALMARGQRQEALAVARAAIALYPRHARAHLLVAILTDDEAPAVLAARFDPQDAAVWRWLGVRALRGGRYAEGEGHFRRVVALVPGDAGAWNDLGRCLVAAGKVQEAVRAFEEAVRLRPELEALRENLEAARGLLGGAEQRR